jgi:hypothetical protein
MSTINYFNIYTLDFSRINAFKQAVSSFTDDLQPKFQAAFRAEIVKERLENGKKIHKVVTKALAGSNEDTPGSQMFSEMLTTINQSGQHAQQMLDQYGGVDPYEIQKLVNFMLGIEDGQFSVSNEVKKDYLLVMKSSGFLSTAYTPTNPLVYQPETLAFEYLSQHPEIRTLTFACGEAGKDNFGSCHYRRAQDHAEASFTIDQTGSMGPDLVVNMHNPNFWKSIPDGRFEKILDHSYGYFLFEGDQATDSLQNLYRVLQSGGYLKMDLPFREQHVAMLKKAGFFVEDGEQVIAKKL